MRLATVWMLFCWSMWGADANPPFRADWLSVADRLIQTPPETFPFNWGEGVQWIGLMKTYEQTHDQRYLTYMERWTALHSRKDVRELLNLSDQPHSNERSAYCGHWSPATAILQMYRANPRPEYKQLAQQVAAFISTRAERSPDGGLGHWQGSHQLWVDTLYMACPLLAAAGRDFSQPGYITDAARQILVYAKSLQDDKTALFYHMWDWQTGERTKALWGRGNGWVLMSIADTVEVMKADDPLRGELVRLATRILTGLRQTQDKSGLWHTILDDPSSYPETSASAMVVYSIRKLHRLGLLSADHLPMADAAWKAINAQYVKDGLVTGVSAGTRPKDHAYYRALPAGTETWGTGAYLMAGSEIYR